MPSTGTLTVVLNLMTFLLFRKFAHQIIRPLIWVCLLTVSSINFVSAQTEEAEAVYRLEELAEDSREAAFGYLGMAAVAGIVYSTTRVYDTPVRGNGWHYEETERRVVNQILLNFIEDQENNRLSHVRLRLISGGFLNFRTDSIRADEFEKILLEKVRQGDLATIGYHSPLHRDLRQFSGFTTLLSSALSAANLGQRYFQVQELQRSHSSNRRDYCSSDARDPAYICEPAGAITRILSGAAYTRRAPGYAPAPMDEDTQPLEMRAGH